MKLSALTQQRKPFMSKPHFSALVVDPKLASCQAALDSLIGDEDPYKSMIKTLETSYHLDVEAKPVSDDTDTFVMLTLTPRNAVGQMMLDQRQIGPQRGEVVVRYTTDAIASLWTQWQESEYGTKPVPERMPNFYRPLYNRIAALQLAFSNRLATLTLPFLRPGGKPHPGGFWRPRKHEWPEDRPATLPYRNAS